MKCSLIVPCLRRRAPHHCGDPDPSRTIGHTSVDFSNHLVLNASGGLTSMAHSLSLGRLLVYGLMIKAAIMKRGFTHTSSVGVTSGLNKHITTETSV